MKRTEFTSTRGTLLGDLTRQVAAPQKGNLANNILGSDEEEPEPPRPPPALRTVKEPAEPKVKPPVAKDEPKEDGSGKDGARAARRTTGTFTDPYVKRDGGKTQKWAITTPLGFVKEVQRHVAVHERLGVTASAWAVEVLRREMNKYSEEGQ